MALVLNSIGILYKDHTLINGPHNETALALDRRAFLTSDDVPVKRELLSEYGCYLTRAMDPQLHLDLGLRSLLPIMRI
jgi:hypothetical protein